MLTAVMLDAPDPTWGVVWREADRQGKLNVPRCEALGLPDSESSFPGVCRGPVDCAACHGTGLPWLH
jgi:hypothetical protein